MMLSSKGHHTIVLAQMRMYDFESLVSYKNIKTKEEPGKC